MWYKKFLTCLSALMLLCLPVFAQQGSMNDLRTVFNKLKAIKTYSFENHTDAVFPNGQKDAVVTKVFMDKTKQSLFYTNKGETLLLNPHWVYKANHIAKTTQVFDLAAYNKRNKKAFPALQTLFQYDMMSQFVDSVVMKYGKLLSAKKDGVLTTYRIGFTASASIKQVTIVYNEVSQLPESIYVRTTIGEGSRARQTEILCNNYKAIVAPAVFDERTYFSVSKNKVVLTQYKNYKVYSLL
jgi:hypothetical protein